jgi:hypothetical protein
MANKELREWRVRAHAAIDPIWQRGILSRAQVYAQLKDEFGYDVHVGSSDIVQCQRIIEFGELYLS